ncbi:MAG TPA: hypothetical protein P5531_09345 [Bacteroidales bacterium]|nr:hypothetical protein [Bacteroidales bacterium]HSA43410.1 hypothetical protein [Bacteroidales bacterium]
MFPTPILFLVFNRPETTRRVFEVIRQREPAYLFIAADGPRAGNEADDADCRQVKEVVSRIDWPCDVKYLYRAQNLGCKLAVSSAITWFFEHVEEGIILEDDCLPDPGFFDFCQTLLEYYRENPAVMHISGDNFQFGKQRGAASYYFSSLVHVWGWASWRRAWHSYDVNMSDWPRFKNSDRFGDLFGHRETVIQYWKHILDKVYEGKIDTWDYQWQYHVWNQGGFAVIPNVNLVSNIGFGSQATHTRDMNCFAALPVGSIPRIKHPPAIHPDRSADDFFFRGLGLLPGRKEKIQDFIKRGKYKLMRMMKRTPVI